MQQDFHYYAIKALAVKAGFNQDDAQIIAYASQYVDDAVDHKEIELDFVPDINYKQLEVKQFNPVCTAHKGIQILKAVNQDVQDKVYISFHFIPEVKKDSICYLTQPDNKLSNELVDIALDELKSSKGEEYIQKLIKLGIAIHSYADTWSHQNFSGRHNSKENDIKDIEKLVGSDWEPNHKFENFVNSARPDIGHAEADKLPDFSHLKWRYTKVSNNNLIIRDNTLICMQAANKIFNKFKIATDSKLEWSDFDYKFLQCFNKKIENLEEKYINYRNKFADIQFDYDESNWKNNALMQNDKKWFYFHIEAFNQRMFVMEKIKSKKDCSE